MQSHSCLSPLQQYLSDHPDIGQGKQRLELGRVLFQTAIANLAVTELALNYSKRVFHFCLHVGLKFLGLLRERSPSRGLSTWHY